jgi:hypothetical protein
MDRHQVCTFELCTSSLSAPLSCAPAPARYLLRQAGQSRRVVLHAGRGTVVLPIQRIGNSIIINPEVLTPGWYLEEDNLVYDGEAEAGNCEGGRKSRAASEYIEANAALLRTVALLHANEQKAAKGTFFVRSTADCIDFCLISEVNMRSGPKDSRPENAGQAGTLATPDSTNSMRTASDAEECEGTGKGRDDTLVVGGVGVGAGISVKVGRQRADHTKASVPNRKPPQP